MKKINCIALSIVFGITASATQAFNLGEVAKITSAAVAPESKAAQSAELINKLNALNVSKDQAIGGTSALLGLAKNKLTASDYSQLLQSVPALNEVSGNGLLGQASAIGGLLGKSNPLAKQTTQVANIQSLTDVTTQFSNLGMDGQLVNQFTPILLQFIGKQGIGQPLLGTLTSIWGAQPTH